MLFEYLLLHLGPYLMQHKCHSHFACSHIHHTYYSLKEITVHT